jgi:hypothetical protein
MTDAAIQIAEAVAAYHTMGLSQPVRYERRLENRGGARIATL